MSNLWFGPLNVYKEHLMVVMFLTTSNISQPTENGSKLLFFKSFSFSHFLEIHEFSHVKRNHIECTWECPGHLEPIKTFAAFATMNHMNY